MQGTALCSACSSSLLPSQAKNAFTTPCCNRPICPKCVNANPRLARYNPCLSCLGGVSAVNTKIAARAICPLSSHQPERTSTDLNIDGSVRDSDLFVLGDDDEDECTSVDDAPPLYTADSIGQDTPPSPDLMTNPWKDVGPEQLANHPSSASSPEYSQGEMLLTTPEPSATSDVPAEYHLKPGDTLLGIALRFGVDVCIVFPQTTHVILISHIRPVSCAALTNSRLPH
jgi:hypothetical protein